MKKVIDGKRYDTDSAKRLGCWESDQDYRGLYHEEEELYRTKAGNYFLYCYGGAASQYSKKTGPNEWSSNELIQPISEERARKWAEDHLDGDAYEMIFGAVDESAEAVQATIRIPAALAKKMEQRMERERCTRNELILRALQEFLK